MQRRTFIRNTSLASTGLLLSRSPFTSFTSAAKTRIAMVGTGHRGTGFWGKTVVDNYSDVVEFVGLCDINPGRLEFAKNRLKVQCPVFTDFEKMMNTVKPEVVIVTTVIPLMIILS